MSAKKFIWIRISISLGVWCLLTASVARAQCTISGSTVTCTGGGSQSVNDTADGSTPVTGGTDPFGGNFMFASTVAATPTSITVSNGSIPSGATISHISVTINGYTALGGASTDAGGSTADGSLAVGLLLVGPKPGGGMTNLELLRCAGGADSNDLPVKQNGITFTLVDPGSNSAPGDLDQGQSAAVCQGTNYFPNGSPVVGPSPNNTWTAGGTYAISDNGAFDNTETEPDYHLISALSSMIGSNVTNFALPGSGLNVPGPVGGTTVSASSHDNEGGSGAIPLASFASIFGGGSVNNTTWTLYLVSDDYYYTNVQFSSWSIAITYTSASTPSNTDLSQTTSTGPTSNTAFATQGAGGVPDNTITLKATVTSGATGSVTFTDSANPSLTCGGGSTTVTLSGDVATCLVTFSSASSEGYHIFTATYSGDGTYESSFATFNAFVYTHATNTGTTYCNTNGISISGGSPASLYPSVIYVGDGTSGSPSLGNSVETVSLELMNLSSTDTSEMEMMLVAPSGAGFEFWELAGVGATNGTGNYTIQDGSSLLPTSFGGGSALSPGTYGPSAYSAAFDNEFNTPSGAPTPQIPGFFNLAAPAGSNTFLNTFTGANGDGPWSLFVYNLDTTTSISGGWCLTITPGTGHATTTSVSTNPTNAAKGATVTVTATVSSTSGTVKEGTVAFTENGLPLTGAGNGGVASVSNGSASVSTTALPEGDHTILATYTDSGGTFNDSFGTVSLRVDAATSTPTLSGSTWTYCNPSGIAIPGGSGTADIGPASPNPSNVFVTNLPSTIATASVTFKSLTLQNPIIGELESLLVGPPASGSPTKTQTFDFFSPVTGTDASYIQSLSNATVTVEDGAATIPAALSSNYNIGSTVGPTSNNGADSFTSSPFYTLPSAFQYATEAGDFTFNTGTLSGTSGGVYLDTLPNGTWSLYFNQTTHQSGGSAGSWCVNFTVNPMTATVTANHNGGGGPGSSFEQGQLGASLTAVVLNNGDTNSKGSTGDPDGSHPLTVTDTLNSAFSPGTLPTGTPWNCGASGQTVTCTSGSVVAAGSSYPTLSIPVNVAGNAPSSVTNQVTVSGGGITSVNSNIDSIIIISPAVLAIAKSHTGTFTQGSTATWTLQVTNNGTTATSSTSGTTTVIDTLPNSYSLASSSGTNWTCLGTNAITCTSSQVVAGAGGQFPAIQLTVNVPTSSPISVSNSAGVYGGGDVLHTSAGTAAMSNTDTVTVLQVATMNTVNAGTSGQSATVNMQFANPLAVTVKDAGGVAISGQTVTFTAPGTGATGTFAVVSNGTQTCTATTCMVVTNSSGVATASAFTANTIAGGYTVKATINSLEADFSLTNNPGSPSTITITSGNNQTAAANNAFSLPLQINVTDSFGNHVLAGVSVTFTAPATGASGKFGNSTNTETFSTDSSGNISAAFTAGTVAGGPYMVTLTCTGVTSPPSFSLTNNPGPASQIVITNGNNQSVTVGNAFQNLQITVEDSYGNAVGSGTSVTFAAPASGASGTFANSTSTETFMTASNGTISASFTSNHVAGAYSVTVSSSGVTTPPSFSLTNNPGPAASIVIGTGNNQTVAVGNAFQPLQITVEDSFSNPVGAGTSVSFAAPGTGASGIFGNSSNTDTLVTTANGTISAAFTANHVAGGPYTVTLSSAGVTSPPNFSETNNPGPAATITISSGNNQAVTVGNAFQPLDINVTDSYGNAVANGTNVTFTAPASGASGAFANSSSTTTLATGTGGAISAAFTANHVAGSYQVTLTCAGVTSPPSFSLTNNPGPASQIAITPASNNQAVTVGNAFQPLLITVEDSYGNAVGAGTSVTFAAPVTGASGIFANSSSTTTLMTAANGTISAGFTANHLAGSYLVTLSSSGVTTPPSFSLTNTPGPAASISITGGNNQSVTIGNAFASLQILVLDSYGNAVAAGVSVTFTAPGVGATGAFSNSSNSITLATLASGTISAPFTANLIAGSYNVTLASAGVSSPPSFLLTNLTGPPAKIQITGGNNQAVNIGAAFAPLQILVTDIGNNPAAGASVTFTAPGTGPSGVFSNSSNSITLVSASNGAISAAFTANLLGGAYGVTLSSTGVNSPPSFALQNNALNVSSSVTVTLSGYTLNRVTHLWTSTLTVTNTGGTTITGPIQVLVTSLTAGVSMANETATSGGIPFITVTTGSLAPGAPASIQIQFQNPNSDSIAFTPLTYSGGLITP